MAAFRRETTARFAAILFALFVALVIFLANRGIAGKIFGWLYNYPNGDKVGHFFLMGLLAFLASLGFPTTRARLLRINLPKSSLIIAALVAIEEMTQLFSPGRTASFLDLAASLAGILLFGELGAYLKTKLYPNQKGA